MFRESTGKLVTARTGLTDGEANGRRSFGVNQDKESVAFRILLRGPKDSNLNIGGGARSGSYSQWASDNLMTEPFQATLDKQLIKDNDGNLYHIDPQETSQHAAVLNWQTMVMENADLRSAMATPQEIYDQWAEILNNPKLQFVEDMVANYEELEQKTIGDIPDIDPNAMIDSLLEAIDDFDVPLAECNP